MCDILVLYISSNNTNYSNARERFGLVSIPSLSSNNTNYSNAREPYGFKNLTLSVQIIQITAMPENVNPYAGGSEPFK